MPKTIATAESCTGGLLGVLLTETPGASEYYLGGVVAYHDRIKQSLLGVRAATLKKHGAVSSETAQKMALYVRIKFRADIGISITGIAGPGGGTREKPVGLVYIALANAKKVECRRFAFTGTRLQIRTQAAENAIDWIARVDGVKLQRRSK